MYKSALELAADDLLLANPARAKRGAPGNFTPLELAKRKRSEPDISTIIPTELTEDQAEIRAMTTGHKLGAKRKENLGGLSGNPEIVSSKEPRPQTFRLRQVAEACIDAGLDPAAEILRALTERVPVLDRSGQPVLDHSGEPLTIDRVDAETRLRTLNELLQYVQPKLKAVEVKLSGHLELTTEQLDSRLGSLLAKAAGARA